MKEWVPGRGVELAVTELVDEKNDDGEEDCEEIGNVGGVAQKDTDDDDGEWLPIGDSVGDWVCFIEAGEADPRLADKYSAEERPGEEPDEMEAPEEVAGELVVVHRVALAEEAQEVLVDEVEPEEAVAVHAASVAETGEDVPGSGDEKEEKSACERLEVAPVFVFASEDEIDDGGAEEEDQGDQAFGEDGHG